MTVHRFISIGIGIMIDLAILYDGKSVKMVAIRQRCTRKMRSMVAIVSSTSKRKKNQIGIPYWNI